MLRLTICLSVATLFVVGAQAQTAVKARYEMTIGGFRVGLANLEGTFSDDAYSAGVAVKLTGAAKVIASGQGAVEAQGKLRDGKAMPHSYALDLEAGDKQEHIRLGFSGNNTLGQHEVKPMRPAPQGTIPVMGAHKIGVLDPLSAGLFTSSMPSEQLNQDACNKSFPIFDGRQRYDMRFSYSGKSSLRAIGYKGDALICKARYAPISGHIAGRADVKFLENNKNMEVWLVPIAGTKNFLPGRIRIETQVGMAVIEPINLSLGVTKQAAAQ